MLKCPKCRTLAVLSPRWDAIYCPQCREWLEPTCGFVSCEICRDRPQKPENEGDVNHARTD